MIAKLLGKTCVYWFWNRFYGICCSVFSTFVTILHQSEIPLPRYGLKRVLVDFETCFTAFALFFRTLDVFLHQSEVPLSRWGRKCVFAGLEIIFTAFVVLFFAPWRLFCIDRRYCFQNMGENVCLPALKLVLRHSPFIFYHFGGFFATIGGTVVKISVKTCLLALKPVLRHSPFFILHFWDYFVLIGGTVFNIGVKTCVRLFWN